MPRILYPLSVKLPIYLLMVNLWSSFDVESFFTNIPLEEAIDLAVHLILKQSCLTK